MATLQTRTLLHRTGGDTGETGATATTTTITTTRASEQPGDDYERRMRLYQGIVSGAIPGTERRLRGWLGSVQATRPDAVKMPVQSGEIVITGSVPGSVQGMDRRAALGQLQAIEALRLHHVAQARQQARSRSTDANGNGGAEFSPWGF
jgi:hypothetical protein